MNFKLILGLLLAFLFVSSSVHSQESICRVKLMPKRDLRTLLMGVKTQWEIINNVVSFDDCYMKAYDLLSKANGLQETKTLHDFVERIIFTIFGPEYYRAIKITFIDQNGYKLRSKIH